MRRPVDRHEFGHTMGGDHTGDADQTADGLNGDGFRGSSLETMSTCHGDETGAMSSDDHGMLYHKLGKLSPEGIHADLGFETRTDAWRHQDTASFAFSTAAPLDGDYSLRFRPAVQGGYIHQTMNFAAMGGKQIDARANVRKVYDIPSSGNIQLDVVTRWVRYASATSGSCAVGQYQTGRNQNDRIDIGAFVTVRSQLFNPSSSTNWTTLTETLLYPLPTMNDAGNTVHAHDIHIRVRSTVKYTSGEYADQYGTIDVDSARVRDRS